MIPFIGTLTLPALSAIAGILIIFLFVTVPDWYRTHIEATQNSNEKLSNKLVGENDQDGKEKSRSKPCIELNKIAKRENDTRNDCSCKDSHGKKDKKGGCCQGDSSSIDMWCGSKSDDLIADESIKKALIVYGKSTGNSKQFSKLLSEGLESKSTLGLATEIFDLSNIEAEDRLPGWAKEVNTAFIVIISTL